MASSEITELEASLTELFNVIDFDRIKSLVFERKLIAEERMSEIEASKSREEQKEMLKTELLNLDQDQLKDIAGFLSGTDQYDTSMPLDQTRKFEVEPWGFLGATHSFTVKKAEKLMEGKHIYSMKSKIRGPCIIINNVDFLTWERRVGSDVDAEKLAQLFEQLHFKIHLKRNLTADGMKNFLTEVRSQYETNKPDCVFVIILTHGKDERVLGSDEEALLQNELVSLFDNKNAPSFQGVPKVFLMQACQGDSDDDGADEFVSSACKDGGGTDCKDIGHGRVPTFTDMLIARASVRGFVSFRNSVRGSWFCNEIVKVLAEHSHDTRLLDMLMMVSERVSGHHSRYGEWQCPTTEFLVWNKQLYFNPGFTE